MLSNKANNLNKKLGGCASIVRDDTSHDLLEAFMPPPGFALKMQKRLAGKGLKNGSQKGRATDKIE